MQAPIRDSLLPRVAGAGFAAVGQLPDGTWAADTTPLEAELRRQVEGMERKLASLGHPPRGPACRQPAPQYPALQQQQQPQYTPPPQQQQRSRLENRSIRRGALQRLAEAGNLSEDELLLFSGDTSLGSLRRYLLWGAVGDRKRRLMTTAAATLAPPAVASNPPVSAGLGDPPHQHTSPRNERWMQFLGVEAPPFRCLPGVGLHPASGHIASKDVAASIDVFAVPALVRSPELRAFVESTLRWTYDDTKFLELLAAPPTVLLRRRANASCRLLPDEIALQLRLGKYSVADPAAVTSWCRVLTLPQLSKRAKRHICEPLLNDLFTSIIFLRGHKNDQKI